MEILVLPISDICSYLYQIAPIFDNRSDIPLYVNVMHY